MAAQGSRLPGYVIREFEDYLICGRLEHGSLRVLCESCRHVNVVAFSCKRRRFCLGIVGLLEATRVYVTRSHDCDSNNSQVFRRVNAPSKADLEAVCSG